MTPVERAVLAAGAAGLIVGFVILAIIALALRSTKKDRPQRNVVVDCPKCGAPMTVIVDLHGKPKVRMLSGHANCGLYTLPSDD